MYCKCKQGHGQYVDNYSNININNYANNTDNDNEGGDDSGIDISGISTFAMHIVT